MPKTPHEIASERFDSKSALRADINEKKSALDGLEESMRISYGGDLSEKRKGPNIEFSKAGRYLALRKVEIDGIPTFCVYFSGGVRSEDLICIGDDDIKALVDGVKHWKKATQ